MEEWKNLPGSNEFHLVSDIIDKTNGNWDLAKIRGLHNTNFLNHVLAIPRPLRPTRDELRWHGSKNGEYTVRSMTTIIQNDFEDPQVQCFCWKKLWKIKCSPKIRLFLWKLIHDGLNLGDNMRKKGLLVPTECWLCGTEATEDRDHLFLTCHFARCIWFGSALGAKPSETHCQSILSWIREILEQKGAGQYTNSTALMANILWGIWLARNKTRFDKGGSNPADIVKLAEDKTLEFLSINHTLQTPISLEQVLVRWNAPQPNHFKLNCDGACKGNPGLASAGAVIRDTDGKFVAGLAKTIGFTGSLAAEAWALKEGLNLFRNLETNRRLTIELDSKVLVDCLNGNGVEQHCVLEETVQQIKGLLAGIEGWQLTHVFREANQVADKLANFAISKSSEGNSVGYSCIWVNRPPACILTELRHDLMGISFLRE